MVKFFITSVPRQASRLSPTAFLAVCPPALRQRPFPNPLSIETLAPIGAPRHRQPIQTRNDLRSFRPLARSFSGLPTLPYRTKELFVKHNYSNRAQRGEGQNIQTIEVWYGLARPCSPVQCFSCPVLSGPVRTTPCLVMPSCNNRKTTR